MSKVILGIILLLTVTLDIAYGQAVSTWTIFDSLRSPDPDIAEKTLKSLGLDKGALGLSKVQVLSTRNKLFLQPCCKKLTQDLFVIAISWEGPYDGYLVLMDSSGNVSGKKRVGYVKSFYLHPLQEDSNDVLVVDAIKGTGTGVEEDQFSVFSIISSGFDDRWNGLSYEKSFPLQVAPDQNYEIKGTLTFDDVNSDGIQEIIHTMKRIQYSFDSNTQKLSPTKVDKETKVYKLENGKYVFMKILAE